MSAGSIVLRSARLLPYYALIAVGSAVAVFLLIVVVALNHSMNEWLGMRWLSEVIHFCGAAGLLYVFYERVCGKHGLMNSVTVSIRREQNVIVTGMDSKDVEKIAKKIGEGDKKTGDSENSEKPDR